MKKLKNIVHALAVLLLCIAPFQPLLASADTLPQDIIDSVNNNSVWADTTTLLNCSIPSAYAASGTVYAIGDSYLEGLQQHKLADDLTSAGFDTVKFDASRGRAITQPGTTGNKLSAMDALKADKSVVQSAGTILIVLGTNPADYAAQIPEFMKLMNSMNGTAKKYWLNTGNLGTSASTQKTINDAIANNASTFNYSVIDWNSVFQKSPATYFSTAGGQASVHPNDTGYDAMKKLIIDSLKQSTPGAGGALGYGAASQENRLPKNINEITKTPSTDTNDTSGNGKIVFQYLIGKGLSVNQVAGVMGNLMQEAHYRADNAANHPWPGGPYGIVQWLGGRRDNLVKAMGNAGIGDLYREEWSVDAKGHTPSDKAGIALGFQLDYMWYEFNHYAYLGLKDLKDSNTIEEATKVVFVKYEGAADDTLQKRINFAKEAAAKYGGVGGLTAANTAGCSSDTLAGSAGEFGWDLTGSNAMVYYSQFDKKYASAWFGRTIKECGCGPTSMAMIISTLNHDSSVNPINVADYYGHHGGLADGCGSNWAWTVLSDKYNLKYTDLGTDFGKAQEILAQGGLVLISVGVGHFTSTGHLMVVRKVTPDGTKFYLADPIGPDINASANTTAFSIDQLKDPSFGNMRHMWGFTK